MTMTNTPTITRPIFLQNEQAGPLVFRDDSANAEIIWQGKGDPMGEDLQAVPVGFLNNVDFLRMLNRGTVTLVDADDQVREAIESQLASPILQRQAAAAVARKEAVVVEPLYRPEKNDYITIGCIGPSTRGARACGAEVPVREATRGDAPPLCAQHSHLAPQAFQFETETIVDGKPVLAWRLATIER